jgi:diguanylate cyclase (GGDEF)-like protein
MIGSRRPTTDAALEPTMAGTQRPAGPRRITTVIRHSILIVGALGLIALALANPDANPQAKAMLFCAAGALASAALLVARRHATLGTRSVRLVLDPNSLVKRHRLLLSELSALEDTHALHNGVFEAAADLMGCTSEIDARQRFAATLLHYWTFDALDLWLWERGAWRGVGGDNYAPQPPAPERPVELPAHDAGTVVLDLSAAISGQAVLVLHDAIAQPSLVGCAPADRRWVMEVLRNQLALSLRRVLQLDELNDLARIDPLTGTHRRWYGEARLAELANSVVTVAMVDIDHFKRINDHHGHAAGDHVLTEVGRVLRNSLRLGDLVCRFGGEEFLVILPDTPPAGALLVAERLRIGVAVCPGLPETMTVSLGVASLRTGEDIAGLLARADAALYRAKEAGRNRMVMDDLQDDPRLHRRPRRTAS